MLGRLDPLDSELLEGVWVASWLAGYTSGVEAGVGAMDAVVRSLVEGGEGGEGVEGVEGGG